MDVSLNRQLTALEIQKTRLLDQLASWDESMLTFQSDPRTWTGLAVLDHIVKTESAILAAMQAQIASNRRVVPSDRVRGFLLTLLFLTPARVKAPRSVKAIVPTGTADLSVLASEWSQTRARLESFVLSFPSANLQFAVFCHPVAGWMTLPRTLHFLRSHIVHHRFQLNRIANSMRRQPR
jgi:uncharacterized damage-inducible protein DinB